MNRRSFLKMLALSTFAAAAPPMLLPDDELYLEPETRLIASFPGRTIIDMFTRPRFILAEPGDDLIALMARLHPEGEMAVIGGEYHLDRALPIGPRQAVGMVGAHVRYDDTAFHIEDGASVWFERCYFSSTYGRSVTRAIRLSEIGFDGISSFIQGRTPS